MVEAFMERAIRLPPGRLMLQFRLWITATVLHALGIDPSMTVSDRLGRPIQLCDGNVIRGVFG